MKSTLVVLILLSFAAMAQAVEPAAPFMAAKPAACASASLFSSAKPALLDGKWDVGVPQPVFDTGCTAQQTCPLPGGGSTTINCSGVGSCSVGTYWITCDGQTTYCGCVSCDLCYCDCYDGGGTAHQCLQECKFNC
jgi:hypothetical protein